MKLKIDMHATKDLKDRIILFYPHKMKIDKLPLNQLAMLDWFRESLGIKRKKWWEFWKVGR